ncbi:response regulator [Chloroflexota bacterium]
MIRSSASKKRILIVDDEPAIRELCQRVLTEEGFEVDTADNGRIALTMISKREYDSYFIDIKMPLMNGKELYESLEISYPRSIGRAVFTTGSAIGQETERFLQSSGRPVLRKPFTIEELKTVINQAQESG